MTIGALGGFRVGVTADRRADEQIRLLAGRGAECVHGAVIKTHPVDSGAALREATQRLLGEPPELVVLTTGLGVRSWLEAADSLQLGEQLRDLLADTALYARGPKAKGALATAGFGIATESPLARYSEIVDTLAARGVVGKRVAVQLDGAGAAELCDAIEAHGATVVRVPVYRWSLPPDTTPAERLIRATIERRLDAVTFTAKPAIENLFEIAGHIGLTDELGAAFSAGDVIAACVGPVCATGFTDIGLPEPMVPDRHRLGAMVQQLSQYFASQAVDITLAGVNVRLQGRLAKVGDTHEARLTERERALLEVLIERPGVVYSKQQLLRTVWGRNESDEHLVEVTIARLRQRLGHAATGVETVIRRGYRVSET